ncbi:MAG: MGH1-like glycoside hydrolase domain-containing protein [Collinsella sp.]
MNSCPEDVQSYMRVFLVYVNFSCLLAFVAAGTIATAPFSTAAPHADTVATAWREEIPLPVYPDAELVDLYKKTWEIAAERVRKGPEGLLASPYLDENCYETDVWIWDTCFMALFSKYAPKSFPGKESLDNFYFPMYRGVSPSAHSREVTISFLHGWNGRITSFQETKARDGRSSSPSEFLQRHFRWFNLAPKGERAPYSSNPVYLGAAGKDGFTWTGRASGMDNTPRGREIPAATTGFSGWTPFPSKRWPPAVSAVCIPRWGRKREAREWEGEYKALVRKINELYWDEEDGFYYDVDVVTKKPCRVKTIASFWPLLAGAASPEQAARMVEHVKRADGFGGELPWPSLARSDRDFDEKTGNYWRGAVWLPTAYMATKALEGYGYARSGGRIGGEGSYAATEDLS